MPAENKQLYQLEQGEQVAVVPGPCSPGSSPSKVQLMIPMTVNLYQIGTTGGSQQQF
jgi:hypothetical protein